MITDWAFIPFLLEEIVRNYLKIKITNTKLKNAMWF